MDTKTTAWTIGGDGFEKMWSWRLFSIYRRTEDQRWSPYYLERRAEYGIYIFGIYLAVIIPKKYFFEKRRGGETAVAPDLKSGEPQGS